MWLSSATVVARSFRDIRVRFLSVLIIDVTIKLNLKMKYQGKKVVGVWIDHKQAFIIATSDRKNVGDYSVVKKMDAPYRADHSSNENAHHKKVAQEIKQLYENVSKELLTDDAIFITGPGTAQEELKNFLAQNQHFHNKEIALGTSDHPTDNQRVAEVRNHFS